MLIGDESPGEIEAAISVVSLTELHYGVLVATDDDERARRMDRLAAIEAALDPLPITPEIARAWGRLAAAVTQRGGNPRRRQVDLAIASTALVERVPLLTNDVVDLHVISDLVDACRPGVRKQRAHLPTSRRGKGTG